MRLFYTLAAAGLLLLVQACGGGGEVTPVSPRAATFSLTVLDDSFIDGGSAREIMLQRSDDAGEVVLSVAAIGARGLKALYCSVSYDAAGYRLLEAAPATAAGERDKLVFLAVPARPGVLDYGQVLASNVESDHE